MQDDRPIIGRHASPIHCSETPPVQLPLPDQHRPSLRRDLGEDFALAWITGFKGPRAWFGPFAADEQLKRLRRKELGHFGANGRCAHKGKNSKVKNCRARNAVSLQTFGKHGHAGNVTRPKNGYADFSPNQTPTCWSLRRALAGMSLKKYRSIQTR